MIKSELYKTESLSKSWEKRNDLFNREHSFTKQIRKYLVILVAFTDFKALTSISNRG